MSTIPRAKSSGIVGIHVGFPSVLLPLDLQLACLRKCWLAVVHGIPDGSLAGQPFAGKLVVG